MAKGNDQKQKVTIWRFTLLLDQHKHKQTVQGVKDGLLPAWSTDGARLAWV
jgi:hypothetical protein